MTKKIDDTLVKILKQYGEDKGALWNCHGVWVAYHAAIERIAAKAGITFDPPTVVESNGLGGSVAVCVAGRLGDKTEWTFGEASPKNNKNGYPYAMAEKRAKDRVVLKLIGLHGQVFSEEESDAFKPLFTQPVEDTPTPPPPKRTKPDDPTESEQRIAETLISAIGMAKTPEDLKAWKTDEKQVALFKELPPVLRTKVQAAATKRVNELAPPEDLRMAG